MSAKVLRAAKSAQSSKASPHSRPEPEVESAELAESEANAANADEKLLAAGGSWRRDGKDANLEDQSKRRKSLLKVLSAASATRPDVATTCHCHYAAAEKMQILSKAGGCPVSPVCH